MSEIGVSIIINKKYGGINKNPVVLVPRICVVSLLLIANASQYSEVPFVSL